MQGKTVALLESRIKDQLAELVAKQGGKPFSAPALSEVPDLDTGYIARLIHEWQENPVKAVIFQTGVGTKALFNAADSLGLTGILQQLLAQTTVVVRGPKPTAVLRSRNVRIDLSAEEPYTTAEVLDALNAVSIRGERVVVQRYGETNVELEKALQLRGAKVIEIPTYRWALPENKQPLIDLIGALERGEIHAVAFTSASQAYNLFTMAERLGKKDALRANLNKTLVASIGPVCSRALNALGVKVMLEPRPPKLGPFIAALAKALSG
ncbi:MAG TPA: uroporphyrinogen-III synthase [Burkholderiales bacterium]|nr:uroporphyrinogen-III synthase [Burkholderiales bacterium]